MKNMTLHARLNFSGVTIKKWEKSGLPLGVKRWCDQGCIRLDHKKKRKKGISHFSS